MNAIVQFPAAANQNEEILQFPLYEGRAVEHRSQESLLAIGISPDEYYDQGNSTQK